MIMGIMVMMVSKKCNRNLFQNPGLSVAEKSLSAVSTFPLYFAFQRWVSFPHLFLLLFQRRLATVFFSL